MLIADKIEKLEKKDQPKKNLFDYIEAMGDKTVLELPFNKIDSIVLCALSYLKFGSFVPKYEENSEGISLLEIASIEDTSALYRDERNHEINQRLFDSMAKSRRYQNIRLRDYYNILNTGMAVQFCAMTVRFEEGLNYVLFRGTDDNLVGWKEDFNMMFKGPVPAQKMAKGYLERVAEKIDGDFYIGGHSKGGNLAIYSASCVKEDIQNRILIVFSHDSPGFNDEFFRTSGYQNINEKIEKQVPKSSVFGLWLFTPDKYDIILSDGEGRQQHNLFKWYVDDTTWDDFIYADELDDAYVRKQKIFNEWVKETDPAQGLAVVETMFSLINDAGINNMNDLNDRETVFSGARKFIHGFSELDEKTKHRALDLLKLYYEIKAREVEKDIVSDVDKKREEITSAIDNIRRRKKK